MAKITEQSKLFSILHPVAPTDCYYIKTSVGSEYANCSSLPSIHIPPRIPITSTSSLCGVMRQPDEGGIGVVSAGIVASLVSPTFDDHSEPYHIGGEISPSNSERNSE